jgi:phosphoribosyl 1,2-cyclic phosphodiesterase
MEVISLQSGSNGNCIYVEAGGNRLLFDAGISGIQAQERLASFGRDITGVDAVVISHDHADHARYAGIYQRKFGLPVYATEPTLAAANRRHRMGTMRTVRYFHAGEVLEFGGCSVETIPTPHDGVDGVAFVIDDGCHRLGILTDLGHVFADLAPTIASLDAVMLESNYDAAMLDEGAYPEFLKRRIRGPGGHLSNREAAELLSAAAGSRLQWACLAHLSEDNNRPELALHTHREVLGEGLTLHLASRYGPVGVLDL